MIINHDFGGGRIPSYKTSIPDQTASFGLSLLIGLDLFLNQLRAQNPRHNAFEIQPSDFLKMENESFAVLAPRLVLSPLIAPRFDAIDVARQLQRLGFQGRYRALVQSLPDIRVVMDDVKRAAPDVKFGVTELAGLGPFD